jgi:CHAT domain-containing protein
MDKALKVLPFLLFLTTFLLAQEWPLTDVDLPNPTGEKIDALVEERKHRKAIELSVQASQQMRRAGNMEGYLRFLLRAAEIETFEVWKGKGSSDEALYPDYKRARHYLDLLNQDGAKYLDDYPRLKSDILYTNAVVYYWLNMPDTAELLHNEALTMRRTLYGPASREVADSHLWLGVLYNWGLQRKDLAEEHYEIARELLAAYKPESRYALGSVYYGLATIARRKFRFDEALSYANQYLSLYSDMPYEQAFGLQQIANVYWEQRDYENSLAFRERTIRIYEASGFDGDLIMEYSNLANDLINLGRHQEAELAMKQAEQILNRTTGEYPYYAKMLFSSLGDLNVLMGRYDTAESYFEKALKIAMKQYGDRNDEVADVYRMRGHMFLNRMKFEKALTDFQRMLIAVVPGFSSVDYRDNPDVQLESPYFKTIITSAFLKGDAFLKWFLIAGDTGHLMSAMESYRFAFQQVLVARLSIGDELSKTFLISNFHESIEGSIVCSRLLYGKTNDPKFIQDLFHFVELTKYLNVLDAIQRSERSNNSRVPVDLLFQLVRIREELSKLQRDQIQSGVVETLDDSATHRREAIVDLIRERRALMSQIASHSGEAMYNADSLVIRLSDLQREMNSDEQILEFFWGKDSVYTISIRNDSASVMAVLRTDVDTLLSSIHRLFSSQLSYKPTHVKEYSRWTSAFYGKMIKPLVRRDKIIVIPDGLLNLIPVEALVVNEDPRNVSFKDLDYLIYDAEISYAYSSGILMFKRSKVKTKLNDILVFTYSGAPGKEERAGAGIAALPGTLKEVEVINRRFRNVRVFEGDNASKTNFLTNVGKHDLIHLGMHGIGDPEIAENSRLIFAADSIDQGALYAYEITNLNVDARLVVLSACETGVGKRLTGEGVYSLARAFIYAGCPSVIMSMWKVHDSYAASIMEAFYNELSDGSSFRTSLRQAKIHFLRKSDEFSAHPANWSAFVLNGQDQSFDRKTLPSLLWPVVVSLILVSAYVAIRKWKL